jgi:hypothetical protein
VMENVSYFRSSFKFSKPNKILFTPASLESSELLCPLNVQLIYQLGPSKSSANPIETDNKRSALTFLRNLILDENIDVTILALLLILLAALSTTTILACMYCRAASKLAGALESHVIHYAAENLRSFAGAISETSNEIRVLEISEPITDTLEENYELPEMPATLANQSTASSDKCIINL